MLSNRKKIVFAFIVVFLLSAFYFLFSVPIEAAETPTLKYEFPCTPIAGGTCPAETATSPAAYIARFYQFALMIAGMLAFGMLIYGGIKYAVSRGNTAQIADAKDIIYQTLWGVALLLGAYLILYTIDPGLVSLTDPKITALVPKSPAPSIREIGEENRIRGKITKGGWGTPSETYYDLFRSTSCPKNWNKAAISSCVKWGKTGTPQSDEWICCTSYKW